jgi:hypothetical protein
MMEATHMRKQPPVGSVREMQKGIARTARIAPGEPPDGTPEGAAEVPRKEALLKGKVLLIAILNPLNFSSIIGSVLRHGAAARAGILFCTRGAA